MNSIKIDRTTFNSKPDNERLKKEIETYEVLEKLNIAFMGVDHEEAATIEDLHEVESALDVKICKNLFLCNSQKTKFYLLIMPGDKKFLTKNLSKQINSSRLSFADGSFMEELLNITPGSLSILGLIFDKEHKVNLVIDKEVTEEEYFGCHPCINTSTLKVKTADIMNKFLTYTGHEPAMVQL
ncbi:MAG TPA: prolyl-tRNA synthetase associated domain-containing protein [Clostridiales bacterium]|nr:prolyl-tRNA synthetase associated domain-containing protein [Clostridiales bacterium]